MKFLTTIIILFIFAAGSFAQTDLSGKKFCIDPGHGGHNAANDRHVIPDPGVDFWESESNFQKALLLDTLLQEQNAWVILTRYTNNYPGDNEPTLTERWQLANANNVDWFNSIHSNATGWSVNNTVNYTLMLLKEDIPTRQPAFPEALVMSNIIGPNINGHLRTSHSVTRLDYTFYGGTSGGFNLGVLRGLIMPGQLSEGSFHDHFPETRRLMNNDYRKMEAYAIRDAFMEYWNVPPDPLSIVAGILIDPDSERPQNNAQFRLEPEGLTYVSDGYYNGFYMFDELTEGSKTVYFDSSKYENFESFNIYVNPTTRNFVDLKPEFFIPAGIVFSKPTDGDTSFAVNDFLGVRFTERMDTNSIKNALTIIPDVQGTFEFLAEGESFKFYPDQPLTDNVWYTVRVSDDATTLYAVPLDGNDDGEPGGDFVYAFKTADDPTGIFHRSDNLPVDFALKQNYPNPFNPATTIAYALPERSAVNISIYNALGELVAEIVNETIPPGEYTYSWDASGFASGIYIVRFNANSTSSSRTYSSSTKMTLLK